MSRYIGIVAGNHQQFLDYTKSYYYDPRLRDPGPPIFIEVKQPITLRGHLLDDVHYVGTWQTRRDLKEIEEMLQYVLRHDADIIAHKHKAFQGPFVTGRTEMQMPEKITPGQARAFMREMAKVLEDAQRLEEKFGRDGNDGAVIRFTKQFLPPSLNVKRTSPMPSQQIYSVLDDRPLEQIALVANAPTQFMYAAIRVKGKWWLTGGGEMQGVEWEDLLNWLEDGVPTHEIEWLSRGVAGELVEGEESEEEGESDVADPDNLDVDVSEVED